MWRGGSVESLMRILWRLLLRVAWAWTRGRTIALGLLLRWRTLPWIARALRTSIALGYCWPHGVLRVVGLWWMRHGGFEQSFIVPACLDEFLVQLSEVICDAC